MDKHDEVIREERQDDDDDYNDDEKAAAAGEKKQAIHDLLALSDTPSVPAVTAESTTATNSSSSTPATNSSNSSTQYHRREEQLLSNRLSARDRRKRQKVANQFMKNESIELKARLQQQDNEIKVLKSRNEHLEYSLRQACIDNLSLLIAQKPANGNSTQQQQQQFNSSSFPGQQMQQNTQQQERQQPGKNKQNYPVTNFKLDNFLTI